MGRTVIVAQARMSSSRLPGKTLLELDGAPVVDLVLARVNGARLADDVVVATTTDPSDDVLAEHLESLGVSFVRGSLDDVLARYVLAADTFQAETVVRVTCDCPLIDPTEIDRVISAYRAQPPVDYCSNNLVRSFPIGMDTEVFSLAALKRADSEARLQHEREHVTPYLYQHPELFGLRNVEAPEWARFPELRLTIDEPADFEMLKALIELVPRDASLEDILRAIRLHPEVEVLNRNVQHRHIDKPASWK